MPPDIAADRTYIPVMSVIVRVLRFVLVFGLLAGFAAQTWAAGADMSRMAALHAKAMQTMDHGMGAMADLSGNSGEKSYSGVLTLCKQHCTAVAVVLPAPPAPPAASARVALIAWPAPVVSASIEPVPTGPPPKLRSA